jgi:predicted RNA-binding Zn-ribbon protein involved in translation (DUF1610 family)
MAAYNWVVVDETCPACGKRSRLRCQTHVASDYSGDASGRFHDREYHLGQRMAWWPREHIGFERWRADRWHRDRNSVDAAFDEEACHATCPVCDADLFVSAAVSRERAGAGSGDW